MSYTTSKFMDAPQVGVLVRNGGRLSGYGKDGEREKEASHQVPQEEVHRTRSGDNA